MKKLLLTFLLALITTSSFAKEVVPASDSGIYFVDGKKVYFCHQNEGCKVIEENYKDAPDSFEVWERRELKKMKNSQK